MALNDFDYIPHTLGLYDCLKNIKNPAWSDGTFLRYSTFCNLQKMWFLPFFTNNFLLLHPMAKCNTPSERECFSEHFCPIYVYHQNISMQWKNCSNMTCRTTRSGQLHRLIVRDWVDRWGWLRQCILGIHPPPCHKNMGKIHDHRPATVASPWSTPGENVS